ncbi:uncharacterized protein LOC135087402 [Ostrinia nubilalis]|uniref:uncharacterized protein LOC135087402 n=1 Tax=Ostrinia nubilalis TaxID=29057 RepID=UPI00308253C4
MAMGGGGLSPPAPTEGPTPAPRSAPGRKKTRPTRPQPPSQPEPVASSQEVQTAPSSAPPAETWATVTRKGKKKKPRTAAASQPVPAPRTAPTAPKPKPKRVKLTPPRSAAIVVTLQPEAAKRGSTYKEVLTKAKAAVDLSELGIPSIKVTDSATGARLIEVPGTESREKADKLADKLKAVLGGDVTVTRPEKRAGVRISGLDESVTKEEVAEAVAIKTGCSTGAVRVGEIRRSSRGEGVATISCPVVARRPSSSADVRVDRSAAAAWVLDRVDKPHADRVRTTCGLTFDSDIDTNSTLTFAPGVASANI